MGVASSAEFVENRDRVFAEIGRFIMMNKESGVLHEDLHDA